MMQPRSGSAASAQRPFSGRPSSSRASGSRVGTAASSRSAASSQSRPQPLLDDSEELLMEDSLVCMSVSEESSRIAFCCYNEETNEIMLEEAHANGSELEAVVEGFLSVARPNLILIGAKLAANEKLLDLLTKPQSLLSNVPGEASEQDDTDNSVRSPRRPNPDENARVPYQLLKSSAFDLRNCRMIILQRLRVMTLLRSPGDPHGQQTSAYRGMDGRDEHHGDRNRHFPNSMAPSSTPPSAYHALASVIDFESNTLVRSLGSLVGYLQSTLFRLEDGGSVTINSIRHAQSSRYMRIDAATLRCLHIFSTEHHPLMSKGQGNSKEGFSLFTLLDRTKSKMGKQCLREWMAKPLLDPIEISKRQDAVEFFLRPECRPAAGLLLNLLQKVGAVDKILQRMQKCHSLPNDFIVLSRTLSAAVAISSTLSGDLKEFAIRNQSQAIPQGSEIDSNNLRNGSSPSNASKYIAFIDGILDKCFTSVINDLRERIVSIVDEEATNEAKTAVVIRPGFHEELDAAKEAFETLDETLSQVGEQVLSKHRELRRLSVIFFPQVGFLISLDKREHSHNVTTNDFPELPEDFTFLFIQDNNAFFKNPEMQQLDEEIGDLDAYIKDTESMIVSELEEDILDCESELRSTFGALAQIDCILSFAHSATDLNYTRPEVVSGVNPGEEGTILIENGRHPLQELITDDDFIPNDTKIDTNGRVNIVTGPNFSGKSCYIRQVGMLVYMAHIGSYIPCDAGSISITDQILARISSVETCSVPQSTFQQDLTQMATILRRSTEKSLVLIDEFGKGTAPASGIAVLTAALKKLSTLRCKAICTTHFLEIFTLGLLRDDVHGMRVLQMAVRIPSATGDNAVPLFKLEKGVASSSAGLVCAKMAGVNKQIVARAGEVLAAMKEGESVKPVPDDLNSNSIFQERTKSMLRFFLGMDSWVDDDDLRLLQEKIMMV